MPESFVKRGRKPHRSLHLDVTMPPEDAKQAEIWAITEGHKRVCFGETVVLPGVVSVAVCAALTEQPRDLIGIVQSAIMLLAHRRVITDANCVVDTLARWDRAVPSGIVHIAVKQVKPPLERIGADTRRQNAAKLAVWRAKATAAVVQLRPE